MYKDKEDYVHLFFYPGLDNHNEVIYNEIELSDKLLFNKTIFSDNSIDYQFNDKQIIKIICKLKDKSNKESIRELNI